MLESKSEKFCIACKKRLPIAEEKCPTCKGVTFSPVFYGNNDEWYIPKWVEIISMPLSIAATIIICLRFDISVVKDRSALIEWIAICFFMLLLYVFIIIFLVNPLINRIKKKPNEFKCVLHEWSLINSLTTTEYLYDDVAGGHGQGPCASWKKTVYTKRCDKCGIEKDGVEESDYETH